MQIANIITSIRIILSMLLLFTKPLSAIFYLLYIFCGLSDMIDGYIARKTKTTSRLGEILDSVADFIMFTVVLYKLYPLIKISNIIIIWLLVIAGIRFLSILIVVIKHKTFAILHSVMNKLSGLLIFLYPLSFALDFLNVGVYVICFVASISAIEELLIHLTKKELKVNRRSIIKA